jgi:hypothetical protein
MSPDVDQVRYSLCRSCQARVRWAEHETTGKAAPIDADPSDGGNVQLIEGGDRLRYSIVASGAARDAARVAGTPLHTNHFQTCPHAGDWRPTR